MELVSFSELIFNPVAQVKFVHTVSAGYVTGSVFVLAISAYYLLKKRDIAFARRSFAIAASFGFASVLSVILLGDESGYEIGDVQKTKLAVIESEWDTAKPPAAFTVFGIPNEDTMETDYAIKIPFALGIIATRSLDTPVMGIKDILAKNEQRIRNGIVAQGLLQKLKSGEKTTENIAAFNDVKQDLGYGLLLTRYTEDVANATDAQIKQAARESIPKVAPIFFSFRIMVASGVLMLILFAFAFYNSNRKKFMQKQWLLKFAVISLPLPWIAAETGWIVAEYGRQPWAIAEILPVHLGVSSLTSNDVLSSIITLAVFYTGLLIVEMYLMIKFVKQGPSSLHTGKYHFEQLANQGASHV
jgi:cytochrome d ubiquinol oxidase subunit I